MSHVRLGRPPKPPHEVRSERVVTFVTPDELERIRSLAQDSGRSLSVTCRDLLSAGLNADPEAP